MKNLFFKRVETILVLLLLFIVWETIVKLLEVPKWLLPAPSKIFSEAIVGQTFPFIFFQH